MFLRDVILFVSIFKHTRYNVGQSTFSFLLYSFLFSKFCSFEQFRSSIKRYCFFAWTVRFQLLFTKPSLLIGDVVAVSAVPAVRLQASRSFAKAAADAGKPKRSMSSFMYVTHIEGTVRTPRSDVVNVARLLELRLLTHQLPLCVCNMLHGPVKHFSLFTASN